MLGGLWLLPSTCTEILILPRGGHFRVQGDGVTQQDVFAQHVTLITHRQKATYASQLRHLV